MADGRSRQLWEVASHVMAVVANSMKSEKTPPFLPDRFNPHAHKARSTRPVTDGEKRLGFDMMRATFCPQK